jgi:hypothetical protein
LGVRRDARDPRINVTSTDKAQTFLSRRTSSRTARSPRRGRWRLPRNCRRTWHHPRDHLANYQKDTTEQRRERDADCPP